MEQNSNCSRKLNCVALYFIYYCFIDLYQMVKVVASQECFSLEFSVMLHQGFCLNLLFCGVKTKLGGVSRILYSFYWFLTEKFSSRGRMLENLEGSSRAVWQNPCVCTTNHQTSLQFLCSRKQAREFWTICWCLFITQSTNRFAAYRLRITVLD